MVLCCCCAAYPPLYPNFPLSAMDTPLKYHEQELSYADIDLKALIDSGKKVSGIARIRPCQLLIWALYALLSLESALKAVTSCVCARLKSVALLLTQQTRVTRGIYVQHH